MNKVLRETLIGAILGDTHIRKTGLNKAFISFEQSSKKSRVWFTTQLLALHRSVLFLIILS